MNKICVIFILFFVSNSFAQSSSLNAKDTLMLQAIVDSMKNELKRQSNESSSKSTRELKKENETLRGIMKGYVMQIDSLNTLNLGLNTELKNKTIKLNETSTERDEFKKEAEEKTQQIKKGSKLQAYSIVTEALRMKLNNLPEVTDKAKKTMQIRSSFTLSENQLANSGRKSVYMQIISPSGATLKSRQNNSIETESGTIDYSDKKEIDYQNQAIDLSIYYNLQGDEAIKGNYKVKIYCDGNLIGTDSFVLK